MLEISVQNCLVFCMCCLIFFLNLTVATKITAYTLSLFSVVACGHCRWMACISLHVVKLFQRNQLWNCYWQYDSFPLGVRPAVYWHESKPLMTMYLHLA